MTEQKVVTFLVFACVGCLFLGLKEMTTIELCVLAHDSKRGVEELKADIYVKVHLTVVFESFC